MGSGQLRIHLHMHTTHVTMSRDIAMHDGFPLNFIEQTKSTQKISRSTKTQRRVKKPDVHLARVLKISPLYANFNWGNIFSVNDAAYPQ